VVKNSSVGPGRYCSPRHGKPFKTRELKTLVDDVACNGRGIICSPRHRMLLISTNEGSRCVSMTWRPMLFCAYSLGYFGHYGVKDPDRQKGGCSMYMNSVLLSGEQNTSLNIFARGVGDPRRELGKTIIIQLKCLKVGPGCWC